MVSEKLKKEEQKSENKAFKVFNKYYLHISAAFFILAIYLWVREGDYRGIWYPIILLVIVLGAILANWKNKKQNR